MNKTIVTFDPINDFVQFGRMMDRLIGSGAVRQNAGTSLSFPLDVFEKEGKLFIKAALPGVNPADVDVSVEDGILTLRGESKHEEITEDTKVYRREFSYGSFSRSIRLPDDLDLDSIEAHADRGFITISINKVIEQKPKALKVEVKEALPTA